MKKKWIILLTSLLACVVIILTLSFTVFTVKDISIDFRTSLTNEYNTLEIVKNSGIKKNKNIFFVNKTSPTKKLEKLYPSLQIINVETVFPSKIVIHIAEREPLFRVDYEEGQLVLDKDLKVLKKTEKIDESLKDNEIFLSGLNLDSGLEEGDFVLANSGIKQFMSSILENKRTREQALGFFKEISLTSEDMLVKTFSDRKILIKDITKSLSLKLYKMFEALPRLYEMLVENGDYTYEEVDRCSLVILNQPTNSSEVLVHIYLDGAIISSPYKTPQNE